MTTESPQNCRKVKDYLGYAVLENPWTHPRTYSCLTVTEIKISSMHCCFFSMPKTQTFMRGDQWAESRGWAACPELRPITYPAAVRGESQIIENHTTILTSLKKSNKTWGSWANYIASACYHHRADVVFTSFGCPMEQKLKMQDDHRPNPARRGVVAFVDRQTRPGGCICKCNSLTHSLRMPYHFFVLQVEQTSLWSTILHSHGNVLDSLPIYRAIRWEGTWVDGQGRPEDIFCDLQGCCINDTIIDMKTAGPRACPVE